MQALLDLADHGMSHYKVEELITKISSDRKLRADLQATWNRHAYPERSMTYAQAAIQQTLYTLTPEAYMVLGLLGMYCHQSGLIQVRYDDIVTATGIKRTTCRASLTELRDCGALTVAVPSKRHAAPIYRVNPALYHKGTRRTSAAADFAAGLDIPAERYILNRELELIVETDTIHSGDLTYNTLRLVKPEEAKPDAPRPSRRRVSSAPDAPLPGQMSIDDFPDALPGSNDPAPDDFGSRM